MEFKHENLNGEHYILRDKDGEFTAGLYGEEIDLCFVVEVVNFNEVTPEDHEHPWTMTLNIFPSEEEVSKEYKNKASHHSDEYSHFDAISYGSTAPVRAEVYEPDNEEAIVKGKELCFKNFEDLQEFVENDLLTECIKIAGMVAFHLDEPWNRKGETGWDTLENMTRE